MKPLAALLVLVVACCGVAAAQAPPRSEAPRWVERFAIYYERSGGFLPSRHSVRIEPGRRAIVKRDRGSLDPEGTEPVLTARPRIGVGRVRRLRALLDRADFPAIDSPGPRASGYADYRIYRIEYRGHKVVFTDVTVPKGLAGLVGQFEGIVNHHLPFH